MYMYFIQMLHSFKLSIKQLTWVHVFRIQTEIRIEIFILVIFEIDVNPLRKCLRKNGRGGGGRFTSASVLPLMRFIGLGEIYRYL